MPIRFVHYVQERGFACNESYMDGMTATPLVPVGPLGHASTVMHPELSRHEAASRSDNGLCQARLDQ